MDGFEQKLKQQLQAEMSAVKLEKEKKELLYASMIRELQAGRQTLWQRIISKARMFWNSTYEISLAPVAAAVCVLLVVVGVQWFTQKPQTGPSEPRYFIQQTDAGIEIIPLTEE